MGLVCRGVAHADQSGCRCSPRLCPPPRAHTVSEGWQGSGHPPSTSARGRGRGAGTLLQLTAGHSPQRLRSDCASLRALELAVRGLRHLRVPGCLRRLGAEAMSQPAIGLEPSDDRCSNPAHGALLDHLTHKVPQTTMGHFYFTLTQTKQCKENCEGSQQGQGAGGQPDQNLPRQSDRPGALTPSHPAPHLSPLQPFGPHPASSPG